MPRFLFIFVFFLLPFSAWAEESGIKPPLYDLTLELDPQSGRLKVSGMVKLPRPGLYRFRLNPAFVITAFSVNDTPQPPRRIGDVWAVPISAPATLRFRYQGSIAGKNKELTSLMSGKWGAVLDEGSNWYPRLPGLFSRFSITTETPNPFRAVTLGTVISEKTKDGKNRTRFEAKSPAPGISLFVGPWQMREKKTDDLSVRVWFTEKSMALADTYLEAARRHITAYARTIGPYPYGSFHVVAAPFPVGLGYPGLTYIGDTVLALPFIPETSLRHEVLHNWWGNGVAVDYGRGNWAEGLTTFGADYKRAEEAGSGATMRLGWLLDYNALPPERDRAARTFITKNHDADQVIGYNKIAFFFHMLRLEIGKEVFERGVSRFWRENKFKTTSWADLRLSFEKETGQNLKPFFDQWLNKPGAARLVLVDAESMKSGNAFETTFTLAGNEAGPFALSVPVSIITDGGPVFFTVRFNGGKETFHLKTEKRAREIIIDPTFDVWRHLDPGDRAPIFRDVTLNGETRTVIASEEAVYREDALALAKALLDTNAREQNINVVPKAKTPLLVIGNEKAIGAYLKKHLPGIKVPETLARGDVRAWAQRNESGRSTVLIIAQTAQALKLAARRLPHYGRKSFVVLRGNDPAITQTLPPKDRSLRRTFELK